MKNLQKVLALVLVVAMALSFTVMATASFTDGETIEKKEAVDVLSTIGIINGYTDGSFKPEGDVTRAEMAKMIATILNKGEDVGATYAGACTFADAAKHWGAGYIAYCAQEGIINGKNASTFDPDGKVTGTEAAKMVLGALGHKADQAGLIGSAWASTTLSLARKNNLIGETNNMTANMGAALNRENAAQLLLNGLKATMVEYTGGTNITIGDVTLTQGATATDVAAPAGAGYDSVNDGKMQLVEECFPKLKVTAGTADTFGRTCNVWTFEGTDVGSYNTAPYLTYTAEVTLGKLYTDLGKVDATKLSAAATYFVDGAASAAKAASVNANLKSGNLNTIGGQGVITEVYFDDVAMTLNIAEINVYAAEIAAVADAVKDANGDVTAEAYVKLSPLNGGKNGTVGYALTNGTTTAANTVLTDGFTRADKGKIVYYTVGANVGGTGTQIQTVAAAQSATGVNKGFSKVGANTVSVTLDTTAYKVNATAAATYAGTYDRSETVYFDANGNIIYSTGVGSSDYLFVKGNARITDFANDWQAQVVLMDGTVKIVELAAAHRRGAGVANDKIYTYVVDAEGKYTLTATTGGDVTGVTNKVPTVAGKTADVNTVFVLRSDDALGNETYAAYTGIANVPSYTGTAGKYALDPITGNIAVLFTTANTNITGASTDKVMALYKTGLEATVTASATNQYVAVAAVVDGAVTSVKLTPAQYAALTTNAFYLASGGTIDANGNYSALTAVVASGTYQQDWTFTTFGAYENGNVTLDTAKYVEANVPVVVWNKNAAALQVTTVDAVYEMTAGTTGHYTTALSTAVGVQGSITGIYMIVDF